MIAFIDDHCGAYGVDPDLRRPRYRHVAARLGDGLMDAPAAGRSPDVSTPTAGLKRSVCGFGSAADSVAGFHTAPEFGDPGEGPLGHA